MGGRGGTDLSTIHMRMACLFSVRRESVCEKPFFLCTTGFSRSLNPETRCPRTPESETRLAPRVPSALSVDRTGQRTPSSDERVERDGRRSLTLSVVRTSLRETATGATCGDFLLFRNFFLNVYSISIGFYDCGELYGYTTLTITFSQTSKQPRKKNHAIPSQGPTSASRLAARISRARAPRDT